MKNSNTNISSSGFNSYLDDVLYSADNPTYIHYEIISKKRTVPISPPTEQTPSATTQNENANGFPKGFRRLSLAEFNNKPAIRRKLTRYTVGYLIVQLRIL